MAKKIIIFDENCNPTDKNVQQCSKHKNPESTSKHFNFISLKNLLEITPLSFGIKYWCGEI